MDDVTQVTIVGTFDGLVYAPDEIPPADRHPAAVYLASLAKGSVNTQRSSLMTIATILGITFIDPRDGKVKGDIVRLNWAALGYQHVQYIRSQLQTRFNYKTANKMLSALRRTLREAWRLGLMPESQYRLVVDVQRVKGESDDTDASLSGRSLSHEEIRALIHACYEDKTYAGLRDAAVIALGYGAGLRRGEIASLNISDYNRNEHTLEVRSGKGNKSRVLPIEGGTRTALENWLSVYYVTEGAMFSSIRKGGRFVGFRRFDVRAVDVLYSKRCRAAGITDSTFHDLRRSFITTLLSLGNDLSIVAKLAGHSDARTTQMYDKRRMESRRLAIATLHVPSE